LDVTPVQLAESTEVSGPEAPESRPLPCLAPFVLSIPRRDHIQGSKCFFNFGIKFCCAISDGQARLMDLYSNCRIATALCEIETNMFIEIFGLSDAMMYMQIQGNLLITCRFFIFAEGFCTNVSDAHFPTLYLCHLLNILSLISVTIL
jgi:hypothetical protein